MKIFSWRTFSSHDNGSTVPFNTSDSHCAPDQQAYVLVWVGMVCLCVILAFPTCVGILRELGSRRCCSGHSRQGTPSSSDLFIWNEFLLIAINDIHQLLFTFKRLQVTPTLSTQALDALLCIPLIGWPLNAAALSLDCYLAVVHPARYKSLKSSWRLPEVCTAFTWLYAVVLGTVITVKDLRPHSPVSLFTFYLFSPLFVFLTASTLRALKLAGPGSHRLADLCPMKRRIFWLLAFLLVSSFLSCFPVVGMLTYQAFSVKDEQVLFCVVFPMVMIIPAFSETFMILYYFHSMRSAK